MIGTIAQFSRAAWSWLFCAPKQPVTLWRVIVWWELRRIAYNVFVGGWGILCLLVFYWAIEASGHLQKGEDAVEPLVLFVAPFFVNVCYTFGWLVEVTVRLLRPDFNAKLGPRLLQLGFAFSLLVISLPAISWVTVWLFGLLRNRWSSQ